jgi:ADP-ribose pyrophosphatase YjhB (NUDIX family)
LTAAIPKPLVWKPNVTVAAIIEKTIDGARHFLLVEEHTPEGLKLNNPAGHLEQGETPLQGVLRETLEETRCTFTPQSLVGVYMARYQRPARQEDITFMRFAFAGTASEPDMRLQLDPEIVRTLWMTLAQLQSQPERLRSHLVLRGVEDYLAGRCYPLDLIASDPTLQNPEIKAGQV